MRCALVALAWCAVVIAAGCSWPPDDYSDAEAHLRDHLPSDDAMRPWVPVQETDGDRTGMTGVGMRENPGWANASRFGNLEGQQPIWAYGAVYADPQHPDGQVLSYALWFDGADAATTYLEGRTCKAPDSGRHWLQDGRIVVQVVGVDLDGSGSPEPRVAAERAVRDIQDRTGAEDWCA